MKCARPDFFAPSVFIRRSSVQGASAATPVVEKADSKAAVKTAAKTRMRSGIPRCFPQTAIGRARGLPRGIRLPEVEIIEPVVRRGAAVFFEQRDIARERGIDSGGAIGAL